ncbi:MAG: ATP-binding protein [Bacteroidota bacterium]|nr:ATP-binding protein [Kiloniellaceae bacterium]
MDRHNPTLANPATPAAPKGRGQPAFGRTALGRLLWPLGLLIGGLVAIIVVLLLFAAREQNALAQAASLHLARSVLAAEADAVENHARDYATWSDAVENLLVAFDPEWAADNIGTWAYEGLNMQATVVMDGRDQVIYGMVEGERLGAEITARITTGLQELANTTRMAALQPGATEPPGLGRSAYVRLDGSLAIASAAPVVHTDGRLALDEGGQPAVLVYVRRIDEAMLESLAERYLLNGLRLVPGEQPDGAALALTAASGAVLGRLVWEPDTPGFATIRPLLLPGVATVLVVGFLLWLVVRHAQSTVRDLEASHRALEELTVSLAAARDRAEQQTRVEAELRDKAIAASRAKSEFLALVSHELRTPLNAILGFSETIATQVFGKAATERYREYARDIHESGSHLLSIINDILDLSKVEAGRYELHEEEVELDDVLSRCAALLRERAQQRQVSLTCRPCDIRLRADARALKQIVFNLLSNAIKFTDAGGAVELAAARRPDHVEISVSDTGIGMSAEDLARARQPFGQAASSFTRSVGGTGLGLNVTDALIALHGGRLDLRSALGKGTVAVVRLPLARLLAPAAAPSEAAG